MRRGDREAFIRWARRETADSYDCVYFHSGYPHPVEITDLLDAPYQDDLHSPSDALGAPDRPAGHTPLRRVEAPLDAGHS